ncbi:MAG: hypothetical protein QXY45_01125 [Candidatus Aenigmatarchaeota archaeon]
MPENQEEAITYEYIRKIQRDEQQEARLVKLPPDFYEKVRMYIDQKEKISKKKKDQISQKEVENTKRVLEDIYNRRETKILQQAIFASRTGIPIQNLTKEEEKLFRQLVDLLKFQREKTLNILTKNKEEEIKLKKVKFTQEVPEFVGIDMKKYGPFKEGDEDEIPEENADLMIRSGIARMVE